MVEHPHSLRQHPPSYESMDWVARNDALPAFRPMSSSHTLQTPSRRHTSLYHIPTPMSRPQSASNLLDLSRQGSGPHPGRYRSTSSHISSNQHQERKLEQKSAAQALSRSEDIADLVDFFQNYTPPSGSYMSQPFKDEDRGRWSRLRTIGSLRRRSVSVPRPSRQIQLPDSAVSGTTTGGHRHIAISIPMEASPLGSAERSQYPVYHPEADAPAQRHAGSRPGSPVRYTNENGVVTVLRPGSATRGTSGTRDSFPGFHRTFPPSPGPPPSRSLPPAGTSARLSKHSDQVPYSATLPRVIDVSLLGQRIYADDAQGGPRLSQPAATLPRRTSSQPGPPPRLLSMRRAAATHPSIDGLITKASDTRRERQLPIKPRPLSESCATEDEEPVLGTEAYRNTMKPTNVKMTVKSSEGTTVITESPLATPEVEKAERPVSSRSELRREKVRTLKRRDMASRTSPVKPTQRKSSLTSASISSTESSNETTKSGIHSPYESVNTLSPIMVVANIEPVEDTRVRRKWRLRKRTDLEIATGSSDSAYNDSIDSSTVRKMTSPSSSKRLTIPQIRRAKARASLSPMTFKQPSDLTPPLSPSHSPLRGVGSSLDRASLSRRREWSLTKKSMQVQEVMESVLAKMREDSNEDQSWEDSRETRTYQDVVELYVAHCEQRQKTTERHLQRLERQYDAWVRALGPMMQMANQPQVFTPTKQQLASVVQPPAQARDAIESEDSSRYATNQEDTEPSSVEGEGNGFNTLEPLMRELADAARAKAAEEKPKGVAL